MPKFDFPSPEQLQDSATQLAATTELLTYLTTLSAQHSKQAAQVVNFLCAYSSPRPQLTADVLHTLQCVADPLWILEYLPVLCGDSKEEVLEIVTTLKQILLMDRALLLPCIVVLSSLPIPKALNREVLILARDGLAFVEETDYPALIRSLFSLLEPGHISAQTAGECLEMIRFHTLKLDASLMITVSRVVASSIYAQSNYKQLLRHFLGVIQHCTCQEASPFDLLVLVNLVAECCQSHTNINSPQIYNSPKKSFIVRAVIGNFIEFVNARLFSEQLLEDMFRDDELSGACEYYVKSILALSRFVVYSEVDDRVLAFVYSFLYRMFSHFETCRYEVLRLVISSISSESAHKIRHSMLILKRIVKESPETLLPFTHFFEDLLYNTQLNTSKAVFSDLCFVLTICSRFKENLLNSLSILLSKSLVSFSIQNRLKGIIIAENLLSSGQLTARERDEILTLILRVSFECSVSDEFTVLLVSLLRKCISSFTDVDIETLYGQFLLKLMDEFSLQLVERDFNGKSCVSFQVFSCDFEGEYRVCYEHSTGSYVLDVIDYAMNRISLNSYKLPTVSFLETFWRTFVMYQMRMDGSTDYAELIGRGLLLPKETTESSDKKTRMRLFEGV